LTKEMKRFYILVLVLSLSVLMIILSMAIPIMTSANDFSILNPDWNGCSDLGQEYYEGGSLVPNYKLAGSGEDVRIAQKDLTEYDLPPRSSVIVILRPLESFDKDEIDHLKDYLSMGGTLLLADDFGTGNELLEGLGLNSRFSNELFVSWAFNFGPEYSVTIEIFPPFNKNMSHILLNYPSTLVVGENTTVHANTAPGWLDLNHDYILSSNEEDGVFPLMAVETFGAGKVVLLSDPSIMINSMLPQADNREFVRNLFDYCIPPGGVVLFDESHSGSTDTFSSAGIFLTDMPPVFSGVLLAGFLAITIFLSLDLSPEGVAEFSRNKYFSLSRQKVILLLQRFTPTPKSSRTNVLKEVAKRHPDWDRRTLERLVEATGPD